MRELRARGIQTLVDGAHAPGQVPLDLKALGAAYYTGNCHKWRFAPKGCAFLYVREDLRERVRPLAISHGATSTRTDRSRFLVELDWTGTADFSPYLSLPAALRFGEEALDGGWPALYERNRALALEGRRLLSEALDLRPPCPDALVGAMASLPLPPGDDAAPTTSLYGDRLQARLLDEHGVEVPILPWPKPPARLVRISAQLYNAPEEYARLAAALRALLAQPSG